MNNRTAEARKIALQTLNELDNGAPLERIVPQAVTVAALVFDVHERAWLRMQLAELPPDAKIGEIPDDLFKLWRDIESDIPDRQKQRAIRKAVGRDYSDSRESLTFPGKFWRQSIARMESDLARMEEFVRDAPRAAEHYQEISKAATSLREVYDRIRARVRADLTRWSL
jgi:hypothetical protein